VGGPGEADQYSAGRPDDGDTDPLHDRLRWVHRLSAGSQGCVVGRLRVSTCTVGVDPGDSPGAVCLIPPPPDSE
jgi:hypothetical protein